MQFIPDDILSQKLTWQVVLEALENAFAQLGQDANFFHNPERVAIQQGNNSYLTMPCADAAGWFGVKQVSVMPDNPQRDLPSIQAWYTLFNPEGTPALACNATLLTRIRTSAVSALAAKYLAPPDAKHLLIIGTGSLAPWMARAHAQVRDYEKISVWGRSPEKAQQTAEDIRSSLAIPVEVSMQLETSVAQADVVSSATTARTPILQGAWLASNKTQHIDLVGAFLPEMVEVDTDTITETQVVVDEHEACQSEAGDLIQAAQQGWQWSQVCGDLVQVVSGQVKVDATRATLFKSVGLALEDLVVAKQLIS